MSQTGSEADFRNEAKAASYALTWQQPKAGSWPSPAEVYRRAAAGDELSMLIERLLR
jgi:hypothetical protein